MFGVQWVFLEEVLDLLYGWQGRGPNSNIWNLIPFLFDVDYMKRKKSAYF